MGRLKLVGAVTLAAIFFAGCQTETQAERKAREDAEIVCAGLVMSGQQQDFDSCVKSYTILILKGKEVK